MSETEHKYKLRISRKTVDKLGVKLYDKVALVISELVSNAYDADATTISVSVPAGEFLATRKGGAVADRGYRIVVSDDGIGMNPDQLDRYYLVVGADRRTDERGSTSPGGRPVMGRKGVGKLAPFGICKTIEIISRGTTTDTPPDPTKPFAVGHVVLNYDDITGDDEFDYEPLVGESDGTWSDTHGTTVILRDFLTRKVPSVADLAQEIAQRFGMVLGTGWSVNLHDNLQGGAPASVQPMDIPVMAGTKISFDGPLPTLAQPDDSEYVASLASGEPTVLKAGFYHDGKFYPVKGWIAYSQEPVKREIASGVRVYCRGKFAAQTMRFDIASGFTGELQVQSYLVGEMHCDWLDEDEDLIHTDRQNIQWSSDVCMAFREWGQGLIREVGKASRRPAQEKTLELFRATVSLDEELQRRFPNRDQGDVRRRARDVAETLAKRMSPEDAKDRGSANEVLNLASAFAPHMALSAELSRAASNDQGITLGSIADILSRAKMAESMTLGAIADKRLQIIDRFQTHIRDEASDERVLQRLLEEAPWLVRPEWTPISQNKSLATVRAALERYLTKEMGEPVLLSAIEHPTKRPDFVLIGAPGPLQIVEIKKSGHPFDQTDFDRLWNYFEAFDAFFEEKANKEVLAGVTGYKLTLVADSMNLKSVPTNALLNREKDGQFEQISWDVLIKRSVHVHEDFIQALGDAGLKVSIDA
ncbi:MAG: hypothetical protein EON58_05730 [Alphaproteobacteria bacterium]|nr:MAG: hypothetical protein EON58_05730 [Alphaproteobacteria bacterium]